jgi:hypothetical protein
MLELSPPLPILPLLRVAGLSGLNTIIVLMGGTLGDLLEEVSY